MNRLVVAPSARRQGLGTLLQRAQLRRAEELGCRTVVAAATDPRQVLQMAKLGYAVVGRGRPFRPEFFMYGRGAVVVSCRLPLRAADDSCDVKQPQQLSARPGNGEAQRLR